MPGTYGPRTSSLGFLPEAQVRAPQQGFVWPHLTSFFPPVSNWEARLWPGSGFQSIPARQLRPRGRCEVAIPFMELLCVTGCAQLLKCFDENAFVLKAL